MGYRASDGDIGVRSHNLALSNRLHRKLGRFIVPFARLPDTARVSKKCAMTPTVTSETRISRTIGPPPANVRRDKVHSQRRLCADASDRRLEDQQGR